MKKLLILTTENDTSLSLFKEQEERKEVTVGTLFFRDELDEIEHHLSEKKYDFIYIRDPFNDGNRDIQSIEQRINAIIRHKKDAHIVDNIESVKDILFEDKWLQYQEFKEFMPKTRLLQSSDEINEETITKARISSRTDGLVFDKKDFKGKPEDYVIQEKVDIQKEYRVCMLFDEIINRAAVKRPKTAKTKIKIIGYEELSAELRQFTESIMRNVKFDFVGLDIVLTDNGFQLIEINRSPQFAGFLREAKINLAEIFIDKLIKKHHNKEKVI